jgi:hypothetical protein
VTWPASIGLVVWLTLRYRSRSAVEALPVPGAGELQAAELPASGRTGELSAAAPVRAAGSFNIRDAIRYSRLAGHWRPAGDPEADRRALLAGQAFRVTALRKTGRRWSYGKLEIGGRLLTVTWKRAASPLAQPGRRQGAPSLPLAAPSRIVFARRADSGRDRFRPTNDWLYAVVTIRTRDRQETLAVPTIDLSLVHAALELANAENPTD